MTPETYLTEKKVADAYAISRRSLQRWRISGDGPKWVRLGARRVVYRVADCEAWTTARTFAHRADELCRSPA